MAIVSGEYHLCDIFIDNFLVFLKRTLFGSKECQIKREKLYSKKNTDFFNKFVISWTFNQLINSFRQLIESLSLYSSNKTKFLRAKFDRIFEVVIIN